MKSKANLYSGVFSSSQISKEGWKAPCILLEGRNLYFSWVTCEKCQIFLEINFKYLSKIKHFGQHFDI